MKRIEEIKEELFNLDMKDVWDRHDYEYHDKLIEELRKLESEVE